MPKPKIKYGRYDGDAVRYTSDEAWELVDGAWREIEPLFVGRLTLQAYRETFGRVPALPPAAFDPCRPRPIRYGVYDGSPVRLADTGEIWVFGGGTWYVPSRPTQVFCYECGVLTEQQYRRNFGDDLPPLPAHAFRGLRNFGDVPPIPSAAFTSNPWQRAKRPTSGWRSPLV